MDAAAEHLEGYADQHLHQSHRSTSAATSGSTTVTTSTRNYSSPTRSSVLHSVWKKQQEIQQLAPNVLHRQRPEGQMFDSKKMKGEGRAGGKGGRGKRIENSGGAEGAQSSAHSTPVGDYFYPDHLRPPASDVASTAPSQATTDTGSYHMQQLEEQQVRKHSQLVRDALVAVYGAPSSIKPKS